MASIQIGLDLTALTQAAGSVDALQEALPKAVSRALYFAGADTSKHLQDAFQKATRRKPNAYLSKAWQFQLEGGVNRSRAQRGADQRNFSSQSRASVFSPRQADAALRRGRLGVVIGLNSRRSRIIDALIEGGRRRSRPFERELESEGLIGQLVPGPAFHEIADRSGRIKRPKLAAYLKRSDVFYGQPRGFEFEGVFRRTATNLAPVLLNPRGDYGQYRAIYQEPKRVQTYIARKWDGWLSRALTFTLKELG